SEQAGFHLRAQRTYQANVIVGAAPRRQIFRVDVSRILERIGRAPRDVIDRLFSVLFSAGLVAPFFAPTVGPAAAETDDSYNFGFLAKAGQMSRHRAAGRVAEADDFTAGKMLVGQPTRALENNVKRALQVAVCDL